MVSREYMECLTDLYRGEQVGEAIFETILKTAESNEQRYILGSMLQFETEGKAIIRPMLMKFGLPVDEIPSARTEGTKAAEGLRDMSWTQQFDAMAKSIQAIFLPKYERLSTLITKEEDAEAWKLAKFMADHERAIMNASENIAAGAANPIAPIVDLLHFPLQQPVNISH